MSRSGPRNLADNAMLRVEVARRLADRILTSPPHQWADAITTAAHQLADHTDTTDVAITTAS